MSTSRKLVIASLTILLFLFFASTAMAMPPGLQMQQDRRLPTPSESAQQEDEHNQDNEWQPPGLRDKGTPPGLEDKGGLPPGLQDREILPPGIRMRFSEALRDRTDEPDQTMRIEGSAFISIPEEDDVDVDYQALLIEDEEETLIEPEWALEEEVDGVTLDEDGILTVSATAEPGAITLLATYTTEIDGVTQTFSATLDVTLYQAEITDIVITGREFVPLDDEETLALTYEAVVTDQHGELIENVTINWDFSSEEFEDPLTDDAFEEPTLTFSLPQAEGTFTLKAATGDMEAEIEVVVYEPKVTTLAILGDVYIALEGDEEPPLTFSYTATLLDQYDEPMTEGDVVWSLTTDLETIAIDAEGVVTLDELPEETATFTVVATAEDQVAELTVTLYYPEATTLMIEGDSSLEIPDEDEERVVDYTAILSDQFEQEISDPDLVWLLGDEDGYEDDIDGVTFDDGTLTISDEAVPGSLWIWCIYDDDIFAALKIELVKGDDTE